MLREKEREVMSMMLKKVMMEKVRAMGMMLRVKVVKVVMEKVRAVMA